MEKKVFNGKVLAYLGFSFAALMTEMYLERRGAFEDSQFICGMFNGAAILLLLHAVYFLASGFAKFAKSENQSSEEKSSEDTEQ